MKKHENDRYLDLNQACVAESVNSCKGRGEGGGGCIRSVLESNRSNTLGCNPVISSCFLTIREVRNDGGWVGASYSRDHLYSSETFMTMLQISTRSFLP